jgi:hypothetical protein
MEIIEAISNGITIVFGMIVLGCLYKRDKQK